MKCNWKQQNNSNKKALTQPIKSVNDAASGASGRSIDD